MCRGAGLVVAVAVGLAIRRPTAAALEIDARLAGIGAPPPDDLSGYDALREAGS